MDLRQSKEFANFMQATGWLVEKIGSVFVYLKKISFFPPLTLKIPYPEPPISFEQIEKLIKKYRPLSVKIQPLKTDLGFKKFGYHLSHSPGHVSKTVQLDLTQSEEKILSQMKKDARYGIKKAQQENMRILKYYDFKEINKFHQAWKREADWNRYIPSLTTLAALKEAFGQKAIFLIASHSNTLEYPTKPIAGTIILISDGNAYYYYAFTSKEGRKKSAQYLLVWEAIKLSKKLDCRIFDFEGIYDERFPIKSWKGFTHFKKSFGGKEVEYPGCFVKYRLPFSAG